MAGGPITFQCAQYDLRFNREGERLVRYNFDKWGYNILDNGVTEHDAQRLDSDQAFRAKYIKQHGYEKYKIQRASAEASIKPFAKDQNDQQCRTDADTAYQVAQASANGVPIEKTRAAMAKSLDGIHVSTETYNDYIGMVNRAYAWQKHGYTLDQIRNGEYQACKGTPVLDVP
ncbi:hypothetical protein CY652_13085 [Burkholderia sp. WAC0059]|nr:hypothetical protein CY652_13085 [Burkholderia sp. WAC0059]